MSKVDMKTLRQQQRKSGQHMLPAIELKNALFGCLAVLAISWL
jgi:hypothetical protein